MPAPARASDPTLPCRHLATALPGPPTALITTLRRRPSRRPARATGDRTRDRSRRAHGRRGRGAPGTIGPRTRTSRRPTARQVRRLRPELRALRTDERTATGTGRGGVGAADRGRRRCRLRGSAPYRASSGAAAGRSPRQPSPGGLRSRLSGRALRFSATGSSLCGSAFGFGAGSRSLGFGTLRGGDRDRLLGGRVRRSAASASAAASFGAASTSARRRRRTHRRRGIGRLFDGRRRRFGGGAVRRRRGAAAAPGCAASARDALFALPARADTRHLVVRQQRQVAAHRDVHLAQQRDDLVGRDPELTRHVMHTKLAQPFLLLAKRALASPAEAAAGSRAPRIPRASA